MMLLSANAPQGAHLRIAPLCDWSESSDLNRVPREPESRMQPVTPDSDGLSDWI